MRVIIGAKKCVRPIAKGAATMTHIQLSFEGWLSKPISRVGIQVIPRVLAR